MKILIVKMCSLFCMFYLLLIIYIGGGLESVGHFSAVSSFIAPISMFALLRYVEYISTAKEKLLALLTSMVSCALIFSVVGVVATVVYFFVGSFFVLFIFIVFEKMFEILSDHIMAFYCSERLYGQAIYSSILRIVSLVFLSFFLIFVAKFDVVIAAVISLLAAHLLVLLIFDFRFFSSRMSGVVYDFCLTKKYIKKNIKFGFMSLAVSLNSSTPRYFLVWLGDYKFLGLFSILYQVSATLVNVLQFFISVKVDKIKERVFNNVLAGIFAPFLISAVFFPFPIMAAGAKGMGLLLFLAVSVIFMFLMLLFRGVFISTAVVTSGSFALVATVISFCVSSTFMMILLAFGVGGVYLYSFYYVILSTSICIVLISFDLRKKISAYG